MLGACLQQRVDRVYVRRDAERRAVRFEGSFGGAGCGNASWSLRLAADLDEEVGRVRPLLFELGVAGHAGARSSTERSCAFTLAARPQCGVSARSSPISTCVAIACPPSSRSRASGARSHLRTTARGEGSD